MKQFLALFLTLLLCVSLFGCQSKEAVSLDLTAEADRILSQYNLTDGRQFSSFSQEEGCYLDEELIRSYYGDASVMPDFSAVEAYVVYIDETKPTQPSEFGIFQMKKDADNALFMSFLQARIDLKLQLAAFYFSTDTEALTTAVVSESNGFVWYCVIKGGNAEIDASLREKTGG